MTILQLKYALSVAEHQNFTIAAEHSCVTQPTLSMQIQKLEEELDIKIFNRSKKPIELTEAGKKIIEQAKTIIDESCRMEDIINQQKGYIGGEFKLGIISTIMPSLLPMFLTNFTKKNPNVTLFIEELTTQEIVKKLTNKSIDAAIATTPLERKQIREIPLYYEPFVGLIPKEHSLFDKKQINVDDLSMDDILLLKEGHCFRDNILNLCDSNKANVGKKNFQLESGSFETIIKLTKEGMGMTLLPYLHTLDLDQEDKDSLREFTSPQPAREVSLIFHKSQIKTCIIRALKKSIDEIILGAITFGNFKIISPLNKR